MGLEAQLNLRHMAKHAATCLAAHHRLESVGKQWGESGQGLTQGDPLAGADFRVACHEDVKELDRNIAVGGGRAVFGNDDGYAMGPKEIVFDAVDKFKMDVLEKHGLTLQVTKTKVFNSSGVKPPEAPAGMPNAGVMVEGKWLPGLIFYGVAIGCTQYVKHILAVKVNKLEEDIDKVM